MLQRKAGAIQGASRPPGMWAPCPLRHVWPTGMCGLAIPAGHTRPTNAISSTCAAVQQPQQPRYHLVTAASRRPAVLRAAQQYGAKLKCLFAGGQASTLHIGPLQRSILYPKAVGDALEDQHHYIMLRSLREPNVAANPSQAVSRVDRCKPLARGEVGAGEGRWGQGRGGAGGRGGGGGEARPAQDFEGSAPPPHPTPPTPPTHLPARPPSPLRVWHYAACSGRATQAAVLSPLPPPQRFSAC